MTRSRLERNGGHENCQVCGAHVSDILKGAMFKCHDCGKYHCVECIGKGKKCKDCTTVNTTSRGNKEKRTMNEDITKIANGMVDAALLSGEHPQRRELLMRAMERMYDIGVEKTEKNTETVRSVYKSSIRAIGILQREFNIPMDRVTKVLSEAVSNKG